MHEHSLTGQINQQHVTKEGHTKCKRCYKDIPTENLPSHECETFSCEECGKVCKSKQILRIHRQNIHEFREVKKEICKICGLSVRDLNRHMKIHVEKTPCPECNVMVKNLKLHVERIHTLDEDKRFQCQDCGKGFARKNALEVHKMNVHLKQTPFQCRYGCDIAYNDSSNRNAHEKKKHGKLFTAAQEEISYSTS